VTIVDSSNGAIAPPSRGAANGKSGVALTATGWSAQVELDMRAWAEHGKRLGVVGRAAGWWIGDWLRYGNARFGERYARAARITGYDTQTLMNMAYVASRFEPAERREALSWSHHAELAGIAAPDRERWLELAESQRMSVRCLRDEIRRARRLEAAEEQEGSGDAAVSADGGQPPDGDAALADGDAALAEGDATLADGDAALGLVCPECGGSLRRAPRARQAVREPVLAG
jgi:hypothetical protein